MGASCSNRASSPSLHGAVDQNHVERRGGRNAFLQRAALHAHLRRADLGEVRARQRREFGLAFERDHLARQPGKQRRRIAGAARHVEHPMSWTYLGLLQESGQNQRRGNRARRGARPRPCRGSRGRSKRSASVRAAGRTRGERRAKRCNTGKSVTSNGRSWRSTITLRNSSVALPSSKPADDSTMGLTALLWPSLLEP